MKKNKNKYAYVVVEYDISFVPISLTFFRTKKEADKYHDMICLENLHSTYLVHKLNYMSMEEIK